MMTSLTHIELMHEMARGVLEERRAEAARERLALHARRGSSLRRVRSRAADALRLLARTLDHQAGLSDPVRI